MNLGERGIGREGLGGEEDGKLRSGCNVREELKKNLDNGLLAGLSMATSRVLTDRHTMGRGCSVNVQGLTRHF